MISKHRKGLKRHSFEMFSRVQIVNKETVIEILRNLRETLSTENLIF